MRAFHGILHADGYAGFNKVYDEGRVHDAACSAHVRRRFYAIQQAHASPLAAEALMRIGSLYVIKAEVRRRTSDEHRAVQQERARPLLDSMRAWLQSTLGRLSKKSDLAFAIGYALGRWPALLRSCDDGRIEIDNNAAERAAAIYSLIGSAKLSGIDPEADLRHVLIHIADHPINRIEELLP